MPIAKEAWFYDLATRTIFDENRLAVARDVGPDDAHTILMAMGCEPDFAIVGEVMPNPLFAVLDELMAYEDQAFEDGEEVDGGELVEFWADRRRRLRSALAYARPPALVAVAREAALLFRSYQSHHQAEADAISANIPGLSIQGSAAELTHATDRMNDRRAKAKRNADMAARLESALQPVEG